MSQREKQLESELEAAQRQSRELAAERDKLKSATQAEDQAVQVGEGWGGGSLHAGGGSMQECGRRMSTCVGTHLRRYGQSDPSLTLC